MSKRSTNFSGMGGKNGRYANSIQGLVDAMRAVGMTDDDIRAELVKMLPSATPPATAAPASESAQPGRAATVDPDAPAVPAPGAPGQGCRDGGQ
jgi:hypothetical protein